MVNSSVDYALDQIEEDVVSRIRFKEVSIGISSSNIISKTDMEIVMVRDFLSRTIIFRFSWVHFKTQYFDLLKDRLQMHQSFVAKPQIVLGYDKRTDGFILIPVQKYLIHPVSRAGWRVFTGLKTLLLDHHGEHNLQPPILLVIWIRQRWLVQWATILLASDVSISQIARQRCKIFSKTLLMKAWGTLNICIHCVNNPRNCGNNNEFSDMEFNFYVGDDGYIYEGRGINLIAAHW